MFAPLYDGESDMKITDLASLNGEVLVFGGPYSNSHALAALLQEAKARAITPERVICTGDSVAYCADAAECVAMLRRFGGPVLAGNCEVQLAGYALDCGCGFEAGTACDLLSGGWYGHANSAVDMDARAWMAQLPDVIVFMHHGRRHAVVHGGFTDIARFVWPSSPDAVFVEEIAALEAAIGPVDRILAGHSGISFEREIGRHHWVNAGAIGMPANDAERDTWFAVLGESGVRFERLRYDVEAAQAAMVKAGLVQGYHRALGTGIWPSQDVLPPELRRS